MRACPHSGAGPRSFRTCFYCPRARLQALAVKAEPLIPVLPDIPLCTVEQMGLRELERLRLILRGGSVIDWRRMHFQTRDEVDRFLRLCQLDTSRPYDEAWARTILADAVEYLRKTFDYRVVDAVARPKEIHDLFLYASGAEGAPRYRRIACIVLKVMHVILKGYTLYH